MRVLAIFFMLVLFSGVVNAQTDTPTPEPTSTPLPDIAVYGVIDDQPYRIDYVVSAGDMIVGTLLLLLLFSVWGLAIFNLTGSDHD